MRVWPVWNPVTLFLGIQNGAATTKNNIAFTQPIKKKIEQLTLFFYVWIFNFSQHWLLKRLFFLMQRS